VSNFNLWTGFDISRERAKQATRKRFGRLPKAATLAAAIKPFLGHIRTIWCRDDEALFRYVLCVLASFIQRPWMKLCMTLVLQGEEGSGKGIILTEFLAKIIGRRHYSHVTGLESICGPFNGSALATACLVYVDEARCGTKQEAARFKTLISEPRHTLENKYTPAVNVESFANFILSSNEERVVEVDPKSRRFCVLQTDNRFSGPSTPEKEVYFKKLLALARHPPGLELVAHYLYELDLSCFEPRRVPATDMQRQQKRLSLKPNSVDLWLLRCIEAGKLPVVESVSSSSGMAASYGIPNWYAPPLPSLQSQWEAQRPKATVYEHYRAAAGRQPLAVETFWKKLQAIVACRTLQRRASMQQEAAQLVCFPSLEECKAAFRRHMADAEWPFEGVDTEGGELNQACGSGKLHAGETAGATAAGEAKAEMGAPSFSSSSSSFPPPLIITKSFLFIHIKFLNLLGRNTASSLLSGRRDRNIFPPLLASILAIYSPSPGSGKPQRNSLVTFWIDRNR
jgi:hypothetical protein